MRTRILLWFMLLCAHSAWAQLPFTVDFETNGEGTDYTSDAFALSTSQYFFRASEPVTPPGFTGPTFGNAVTGPNMGTYFWACEGVRGIGSTPAAGRPARSVTLKGLDVSNYTGIKVKVAFADARGNTQSNARATHFMRVQYRYGDPNGTFTDAGVFTKDPRAVGTAPDISATFSKWTRTGTYEKLGATFTDHEFDIPAGSGQLYVRVEADYTGSNNEIAFDNIRVTGTASAVQKPTIVSTNGNSPLTFAEGTATPLTVFNSLTVGNPVGPFVSGATVTITPASYAGAQDVLSYNTALVGGSTGISFVSNSGGVLTFTGTAPVGNYEALLESVAYRNSEVNNATAGDRTLNFVVKDGTVESIPLSRVITVTASLNAATLLPRIEDFDSDGEGTRYGSNTRNVPPLGFLRLSGVTGGNATPGATYNSTVTFTNLQGTGYWYSIGSNTAASGGIGRVTLAPVNTTGFVDLHFKIKAGANSAGSYNANDFLRFSYSLDGTNWTVFANYIEGLNNKLRLNGLSTNPVLDEAMDDLDFALPSTVAGTNVHFRVEVTNGTSNKDIAFDNIQITGTSIPTLTTKAAAAITGTSATLGGDITSDGGGTVTARGVVYSTTNTTPTIGGTNVTQDPNAATTNDFSKTVSGLTAGTTYYVRAYATNAAGTSYGNVQTFTTQTTVTSIVRASAINPTNAASVSFTVTFANSVTGLTTGNFATAPSAGITGSSVSSVSGSGTTYTVTVNTGSGDGTLGLNMVNSTNMTPGVSNLPFTGQTYTIDKTRPTVAISSTAGASGGSTTTTPIPFTVTFSENVSGFVFGDVTVTGGSITGNTINGTSPGTTYTFTVTPTTAGTATTVTVPPNVAQDAAGNGNTAAPSSYSITYQQPQTATPVLTSPANGSVTGNPTFAGTAPAGATVTLYLNNTQQAQFTANGSGNFTYQFATPPSSGTYTAYVTAQASGQAVSANSNTNTFTVDSTPPAAPVVVGPANGAMVNINNPTYTGTAEPNSTVTVIVDGSAIGTTTANGAGFWSRTQSVPLADGSHTVRATATDAAGNTSPGSNTNTFTVDTTPPVAPVVVTPANGSTTNDNTPTYTGTAVANTMVTVLVDGTPLGTTTATAAGSWSYTQPSVLADGSHTVRATATDAAGNTSPGSTINTFTVDTTPPAAPVVTTPANGSQTANTQPVYSGTAEPNSTVTVLVDGSSIGTTTATGAGNWSLTQPSALAFGSHTVRATATDAVGNTSPNSNTNTFTVLNPATYTSSAASQASTARVLPGSTNQAILQVAVVIGGGPDLPLSAQSFSFTTTGTTSAADIDAARVYYTGTSSAFATTTAFGSAVANPNGAFTISGTQQLSAGTNYFWLVYDVDANAPNGNLLDATVPSLTISGTVYNPTSPAPAGSRQIIRTSRMPGQALSLPVGSTSAYVDFSNNGVLLNGSYTQEAWIKLNLTTSSTVYYVLGNGLEGSSSAAPFISITGNGRLQAGFGTGTGSVFARTSPNTLVDDEWNHVVATYNEATDLLLVYLNGVQVLSTSSTTAPNTTSRVNYVGAAVTNGTSFPGEIDEISQWTRPLSQTEIRLLRHLIRNGTETGLVSYMQFNDSGNTTSDVVSGAVGTLMGSATRISSTAPVGYGTSNLQTVAANATYAFPPTNVSIAFTGVTGSSETVVSRLDGQPMGTQPTATGLKHTFTPAYWIIDKYAGTFTSANVTYTLSPTDISPADAATPSTLKLFKRGSNADGAFDAPISATAANAAAGTVTFPVTSFSQTVIGTFGSSPLPVTLVDFTAERQGEDALLKWSTAQEKNNAYFAVESSVDGREFRLVERRTGQGTSTSRHDYQLLDRNLGRYGAERVYYRLRQVDYDGTETLSDLRVVAVPGTLKPALMLYPNPARSAVKLTGAGTNAAVQVYDALGRLVIESRADASGTARLELPESLPTGVYVVRAGGQTQRLVVE